jgi:branched-chain amino acid transport system substrate-binding protein
MAVAYETVRALTAAGPNPTRAGLMAQVRKLNDPGNPFLLPGIVVKTSATERFPVEQVLMQRWSKGTWSTFGGLWGYRAG